MWMTRLLLAALATLAGGSLAQPKARGIESPGYVWNAKQTEKLQALRLEGNLERGARAYAVCIGCHLSNAAGRPDGNFPTLAGQHTTVLIKQLADIRSGLRDNPIMYPYATTLTDPRELADVAAWIHSLRPPTDNGRGPGTDLQAGQRLYRRDCAGCHGEGADGVADKFYPALSGQHFRYLVRQSKDIRDGRRRNANPEMARVIRPYSDQEVAAVSDYLSRLPRTQRD
jgi:cytochrome c553